MRLWDAATGTPVGVPLRGHGGTIYSTSFSPDGRRIVSASYDGTAIVWTIAPTTQELIDQAKALVPRCLSADLRTRFGLSPEPPAWCIGFGSTKPPA